MKVTKNQIKLAIINSGLIDQDGYVNSEYDYSHELEVSVNNIFNLLSTIPIQEDKECGCKIHEVCDTCQKSTGNEKDKQTSQLDKIKKIGEIKLGPWTKAQGDPLTECIWKLGDFSNALLHNQNIIVEELKRINKIINLK